VRLPIAMVPFPTVPSVSPVPASSAITTNPIEQTAMQVFVDARTIEKVMWKTKRDVADVVESGNVLRRERQFEAGEVVFELPESNPLASGDQEVTLRPRSSAIGMSSRSGVRWMRLYSIWSPMKGDQPDNSASVLARETYHAGASEMPTYRTLPVRTRSSRPRMTSSTGVSRSQACTQ